MIEKRYTISELQDLTSTNRRTTRFYSQRGLIPGPDSRGGAATCPKEALIKLKIIKELQKRRFTLEEINELFETDYERLKEKFINDDKDPTMPVQFCFKFLFVLIPINSFVRKYHRQFSQQLLLLLPYQFSMNHNILTGKLTYRLYSPYRFKSYFCL